ncbi:MAG: LD-carboxypeptidase [Woeseiaceae bacterium]
MNRRDLLRTGIVATVAGAAGVLPTASRGDANRRHKPRRLAAGNTVGLVAPAGPAADDESVRYSIELLESFGFRVRAGEHVFERNQYLAGEDRDRAADVNAMFADDAIDAIFTLRGGYGTQRMLSYLDYDMIASNPKVFIGSSDITGILIAMHEKAGLVGFHGPSAGGNYSDYALAEFRKVLWEPAARTRIGAAPPVETGPGRVERRNRVTRFAGGKGRGRLIGGNLTLVSTLMGTPYEPDFRDRIVFLEDVNEAPYRIDRMLTQLWLAGKLQHAAGIAFGKFTKTDDDGNTFSIEEIISHRCADLGIPVVGGLMIGHIADKTTVPMGIEAELDADAGTLDLLEPAVT